MTDADQSGWDGILDEGEVILWQGAPDASFVLRPAHLASFGFGVCFAGFALFWMLMASAAGGGFWMFGLLHFGVGVGLAIGPIFWSNYRRRHTWYSLSDRRAFIATNLMVVGKSLKSYPITEDTELEFIDGAPASIHFAKAVKRGKNSSYTVPIGFERLRDARDVYGLMRKVQNKARAH